MKRNRILVALSALIVFAALSRQAAAAQYDPPATYYNSATGTGTTLKAQLNNIIDGHSTVSYDDLRSVLQITDADPNNPGHMILVYNRESLNVAAINPGSAIPGWDFADTWNREHTWPQSRGLNGTGAPDGSDLHHLRPSRTTINNDRAETNFGGAFGQAYDEVNDGGVIYWYPGDADAGMIARSQFYMAVRYDGADSGTVDLELGAGNIPNVSGNSDPPPQLGNLTRMIQWHYVAIADDFERRRHQIVYDDYQGNRNPFIDHPEWVWSVFVDQQNDSQLYVGAAPNISGGSAVNVDLGPVIVGASVPAAQNVTLNKNGDDGTYYEITTSGQATSSVTGKLNAFQVVTSGATPKTRTLTVGLNTTTTTAGMRSGTVTINNMDITTAGGSGKGANDANDTINVSLPVLDHANPSFSLLADQNTLNYDFGTVTMGSNVPLFQFDIANLIGTANYTAKLDLDSIGVSGHGAKFPTDMFTFGNGSALAAGASLSFDAAFDTSAVGSFAATYTLNFSDENLSGASSLGSLTLNFTGEVEQAVVNTADFDGDGDVDGRDFLTWQRGFGTGTTLQTGDANGSETVDELDLLIWQEQYGQQPEELVSFAAVPEPTSAGLVSLCSGLCLLSIRRPPQVVF
jgi:endonuclease I